ALSDRPGDPSATLSLAVALERMGDLGPALEMYEEAHRLLPDHAPVLVSLVELQQRMGDLVAAATSFVRLAAVYVDQGQPRRAEEIVRRLDDLPPPDSHALHHLADVAERVGNGEILGIARERLASLAPPSAPTAEAAPSEEDAAAILLLAPDLLAGIPLSQLAQDVPEPVQTLIAALVTREHTGRPSDGDLARMAAEWCPLPAELLRVAPVERTNLAVALYESSTHLTSRRLSAALDTCWSAIGLAADYLPAQVQLARVDLAGGDAAVAEWRLKAVAALYEADEKYSQAAETWEEMGLLILGPEEVEAHVVDLLIRHGAPSEAVTVLRGAASRCLVEGRIVDAVQYLTRALDISPGAVALGLWRARLLVETGRADEALRWVERSLESAVGRRMPADRRLLVARTILAARAGRWSAVDGEFDEWRQDPIDDAARVLTDAAAWGVFQGGSDLLWYLAGEILRVTGEVEAAEDCYRAALSMPGAPVATVRFALGRLATERRDWRTAATWFTECLDGLPSPGDFGRGDELLRYLLHVAEHLRDIPLRIRALRELVQLHPSEPDWHPQLAECLSLIGDREGARRQLQGLAEIFDRLGDSVWALAAEHAAASMTPLDPASQLRFAQRCRGLQFGDDAVAALERVLDLEAATGSAACSPSALRLLIDLSRPSEPRRALAYLERLTRVCPTDWEARRALVAEYLGSGRIRWALGELRSLASNLGEAGRWPDAASALREALALDPWNADLIAEAARALAEAGQSDAAANLLRRRHPPEPVDPAPDRASAELDRWSGAR
ncbi:MAG TPA: tetratricopeptide repeat protein, partial [Chloroflexota bacterium]|nr:tetratricopeptide repeat protein [Chloroflexota bacterium]